MRRRTWYKKRFCEPGTDGTATKGAPACGRGWYRIATNVCIDTLRTRTPRSEPRETEGVPRYADFPWMQPYPDTLLDAAGGDVAQPDSRMVRRETIELAFLATIQSLPAKQRAVLILRDILDFSAAETAEFLEDSTAAVNSTLQRARATLHKRGTPPSSLRPHTRGDLRRSRPAPGLHGRAGARGCRRDCRTPPG